MLRVFLDKQKHKYIKLEIEKAEFPDEGYFMYLFKDNNFAYDDWYKTLDEALDDAYKLYSIKKEGWEEVNI